jgi:hypothetical protein
METITTSTTLIVLLMVGLAFYFSVTCCDGTAIGFTQEASNWLSTWIILTSICVGQRVPVNH